MSLKGFRPKQKVPEDVGSCNSGLRIGDRIRGTLGDIDPLNKVPV